MIVLEISAACDYSQKKERLESYLFGFLIKHENSNKYFKKKKSIIPESSLRAITYFCETDRVNKDLWVNFNFVSSSIEAEPIFKIKSDLVTKLGSLRSNHVARIGITEFKP